MKYLVIQNQGLIDPKALALMGASVKDVGAIGEFGSGLKYAIATLLREGVGLTIYSGKRRIGIEVRTESFRDQSFGVIHIDGQPTSITTRTGPKWKVREAIREIYSNALDEGGAAYFVHEPEDGPVDLPDGASTFIIEATPEIQAMIDNWSQFFCRNTPAFWSGLTGRVIDQKPTNYFRRGIWICEDRNLVPLFSYDFDEFDLPESRKVESGLFRYHLWRIMERVEMPEYWDHIIQNHHRAFAEWNAMEWSMSDSANARLSQAFLRSYDYLGHEQNQTRLTKLPPGRILWTSGIVYSVLSKCNVPKAEEAVDYNDQYEIVTWPIGLEAKVMTEVEFLARHGIKLDPTKVHFAEFKDGNTIAMADVRRGLCLIGDDAINASGTMLCKALIEEWTHLRHGVRDLTVEQQHVYLDLICNLLNR